MRTRIGITLLALATLFSPYAIWPARACCPDSWEGPWTAEYFSNRNLAGPPVLTRVDNVIDFNWGVGSPDPRLPADNFSVRWTRRVHLDAGNYDLVIVADDGTRVYLGDRLVIDNWREMQGQPIVQAVFVPGGFQTVIVEYFEGAGGAQVKFFWKLARAGWLGEYWNNTTLAGNAVATIHEHDYINFAEGVGWPPAGVATDNFSVRWLKSEWFNGGRYLFKAESDTGLRMWVDSDLVINQFNDSPNKGILTVPVDLTTGVHSLRVDYYQNGGPARVNVWWEPETLLPDWTALYYNNMNFFGGPVHVRSELSPYFNSGLFSPVFGVNHNNFAIRWLQQAHFDTGAYRFSALADDGVEILINHVPVVQARIPQNLTFHQSGDVWLAAGTYLVAINYIEFWETAQAKAWWSMVPAAGSPSISDEATGSVLRTGTASDWRRQAIGYGGSSYYVRNVASGPTASAEWHMSLLQPGLYDVLAYIPGGNATTTSARYAVHHGGVTDRVTVNQSRYRDAWVSLGTFWFSASGLESVGLSNATGEVAGARSVAFDAIRFQPSGGVDPAGAAGTTTTAVTAVSTAPPQPVGSPAGAQYVVKPGDTLYKIARRLGISPTALIAANPQLESPNLIHVGDVINLP